MKLIATHVKDSILKQIDARIGKGSPGDLGHYATRSAFVRAAIDHLLETDASASTIRQRERVQPVATHASA
ncbi:hypothetical protein N181_15425 [Sinorhizobium fredii USDA 205]|uniref:Uncharacterized protein n=1 Tax=Rhizobium fredii TaxID=380 RepID=A0A844AKT4_RHIFR|nr:hypothetical protein [Sinorhizobium fredii]AWM26472.1 hypothetical protein AOX55_00003233 [Sinorhizobium fredii CCBAU 25509]KSV89197.1 hypothetical protein N181_15425 [Sinorhizobium fredii USDA 205]MQW97515.1 hypothetical protein [Sinorhizobium fredii]MQX12145.1 hypothetical protein [Sinorhizobium fredii]GEC34896.1 hypothetical protein EFR01_50670 [Sinorhizobium fredii]